jgi:polysaccharide deacetylase 2 family uncharacterized protein YibQ
VVAGAVVVFIAGMYWGRRGIEPPPQESATKPPAARPAEPRAVPQPPAVAAPPAPPSPLPAVEPGGARIALVIDDLGRSVDDVGRLQRLAIPWTGAVLPFETRTAEVVEALRRQRVEYLCHLPMQPASANPGPGALRMDMNFSELSAATRAALEAVPGASGVNNHMGSVLSAEAAAMRAILGELVPRDLFFLDSRTSAESVGYEVALELGLPAAERHVFLDSDPRPEAVAEQFARLLEVARTRGAAVAIGHPRSETFAVLEREVPRALAAGYEFVPASYLLDRPSRGVVR